MINEGARQAITKFNPTVRTEMAVSYRDINNALNCEDVAQYLGLDVKRHFCICPFHDEKTASMRLYREGYYCFGCQASGDSIDLASKVMNVKPAAAVVILNDYFHLGLDLKRRSSAAQTKGRKSGAWKGELYDKWYQEALSMLSDYIRISYNVMNATTLEESQKAYGRQEAERVELLQDEMFTLKPVIAYKKYKKEVMEIDKGIKRGKRLAAGVGSGD